MASLVKTFLVSHCFGIINPSVALAKKYMEKMLSAGAILRKLSDQDLQAAVFASITSK